MQTLTVELADRSYPIHIGEGLLGHPELIVDHLRKKQVAIVTNETIAPLYLRPLADALRGAGVEVIEIVVPDGESYKNWETLNLIYDGLLRHRCERKTTLIALGGGVIGDLTGFAAATYLRGVPFIQIPTTLLAQVDSSVGGKTGINHPLGKNMIGAFYQPKAVLADIATLSSLPPREFSAGLAEVIKYGLIRDLPFLEWLETNLDRLLARDAASLAEAVRRSCENKAKIVAEDEHETGVRALLNLGHTFGHAIEAGLGFGVWLHGEAVAAGTVMAADLSRRLGMLGDADVARVEGILARCDLPVRGPTLGAARYLELMGLDKKVEQGKLRLILLQAPGDAVIVTDPPRDLLTATLEECVTDDYTR